MLFLHSSDSAPGSAHAVDADALSAVVPILAALAGQRHFFVRKVSRVPGRIRTAHTMRVAHARELALGFACLVDKLVNCLHCDASRQLGAASEVGQKIRRSHVIVLIAQGSRPGNDGKGGAREKNDGCSSYSLHFPN